jgi:hypothetical protein
LLAGDQSDELFTARTTVIPGRPTSSTIPLPSEVISKEETSSEGFVKFLSYETSGVPTTTEVSTATPKKVLVVATSSVTWTVQIGYVMFSVHWSLILLLGG